MKIFPIAIVCLFTYSLHGYCQDSAWTMIDINGDIKVSLPAPIDTMKNVKNGPNTFDFYTGKRLFNMYVIQCSSEKINLDIYDSVSYNEALTSIQNGELSFYRAQHMETKIVDTIMNGIHMKSFSGQSLESGRRFNRFGIVFILNDRVYTIYAIQGNYVDNNSSELKQFLSSIHFASNKQEQMFATKKQAIAYNLGRMIGSLIVLAVVVLVIVFVVRAII